MDTNLSDGPERVMPRPSRATTRHGRIRTLTLAVALGLGLVTASSALVGAADGGFTYHGPGVVVADEGGSTFVDNGAVVCEDTDGDGVHEQGQGGVCIPFNAASPISSNPAIHVSDDLVGEDVAFQVCVDNDGDGRCGFRTKEVGGVAKELPGNDPGCFDEIRFSHGDDESNINPLSVPDGFQDGCADNGGFAGWVVMICAGAHAPTDHGSHPHEATDGTVQLTSVSSKTGQGDFCGGPTAEKAYVAE